MTAFEQATIENVRLREEVLLLSEEVWRLSGRRRDKGPRLCCGCGGSRLNGRGCTTCNLCRACCVEEYGAPLTRAATAAVPPPAGVFI